MQILVTGINGFIASALAKAATSEGHKIAGTSRSPDKSEIRYQLPNADVRHSQDKLPPAALFTDIDVAIHLAHDFKSPADVNVERTIALAEILKRAGVKKQIFLSSFSATDKLQSDYGYAKRRLESYFLHNGHTVICPGFVVGDGGVYKKLKSMVNKFPVVPVPTLMFGMNTVPVTDLNALLAELMQHCRDINCGERYVEVVQRWMPLKDLAKEAAKEQNRSPLFFPVPASLAIFGLRMLETLGVKMSLGSDNLRGFIYQNHSQCK